MDEPTTRIPSDTGEPGDTRDTEPTAPLWDEPQAPPATYAEQPEDDAGPFHPVQTGYLVLGLLALGIAVTWLLTELGVVEVADGGVAFSLVLVASGVAGLAASVARAVRGR